MGPDYEPPAPSLPAAYAAPVPALFRETEPANQWWELFGDETMDGLVRRGLVGSLDLGVAASVVREARAVARGVTALAQPQIDIGGGASGSWLYEGSDGDRDRDNGDDREAFAAIDGFIAGVWEIDLFGRLLRSREAAWAEAERQAALAREAARITAAEIARTYVELRATQRRLALTEQSLELQLRTLQVVEQRVSSGLAPGLDRVRAEAAVATLQADIGPLRSQVERLRNALAVLLGEPPGALVEVLAGTAPIPVARTGAAIGVPADLLRRRPDLQAAELRIAAATAEVGVATADLYPRLTLPGSITAGLTGIGAGAIVPTVIASLSTLVDMPLYDGGVRRANLTAAEERALQASLLYRRTLLAALEQVEAALLNYQGTRARREALVTAVENNRLAYDQSQELYRQGLVTFLDVLDSQREWNDSLQELATAERDLSVEVINLYTAIGGAGPLNEGADATNAE